MEGATQKSLDEEVKSTDENAVEPIAQKIKAEEDTEHIKLETQSTSASTLKRNNKVHTPEDNMEPTSTNAIQNEQTPHIHDKDTVDSADTSAIALQSNEQENTSSRTHKNGIYYLYNNQYVYNLYNCNYLYLLL